MNIDIKHLTKIGFELQYISIPYLKYYIKIIIQKYDNITIVVHICIYYLI